MRDKSDRTPDIIIGTCVGGSFFKLDDYIV